MIFLLQIMYKLIFYYIVATENAVHIINMRGDFLMIYAIIMSGGLGSRFWPKSRRNLPKQFLKTVGDKTMIECTVDRISNIISRDRICVVTNKSYVPIIQNLLAISDDNIFKEPLNKETS